MVGYRSRFGTTVTAVIVTEHRLLGDAMAYALRLQGGFRCVQVVDDLATLGQRSLAEPAIALVDAALGLAPLALARVARQWPGVTPLLFDCPRGADGEARGSLTVARDATLDELLAALRRATDRGPRRRAWCPADGLSRREQEISALIAAGLSNREIACRLGIALATVKNHVHRLLTKLHARSRWQAAATLRDEQPETIAARSGG